MKLAVVGVGNAGSRIVNRILEVEGRSGRNLTDGNVLLVNATRPAFETAERVPEERRLVIGDVHRSLDGQGTDGDPDLGREVAREERSELLRAFDALEFYAVDGVLVVAGLAGGIGGGAGSVVIDQLSNITDVPIYAVGALPEATEGPAAALTAARSLRTFVERADNVLAFDTGAWKAEDAGSYAEANGALAERVVTLFAAGEFDGNGAPENRLDPSDIMRTLDTGGVSTIGYATADVSPQGRLHQWLRRLRRSLPLSDDPDDDADSTDAAKLNALVRRATHSKLTLPCSIESADRALILLSGPSHVLSRKGFESGRYWLEGEADVVDVMAGDEPHEDTSTLTAVVLFTNVTDVPRIDALQEHARAAEPEPPSREGMRFGAARQ